MNIKDGLHYIAIGNPVSKAIIGSTTSLFTGNSKSASNAATIKASQVAAESISTVLPPLWKLMGRNYYLIRLAGISGASAVILGAIGSHKLKQIDSKEDAKSIFETANRFHFFHSLALIAAPLVKYPIVSGSLLIAGMFLFSGTLYHRALTGDKQFARWAPIGGSCLILAWLSLLL